MLKPELEGIDGFIDNERFTSRRRPGWVLSHSTWRDEKSVIRWRTHAGHHLIQGKGRSEVFADYHLRVGEVMADSHPPDGYPIREQRFDSTEVGVAKVCTLMEMLPDRPALIASDDGVLPALGLDPRADGLVAWDAFDSFTTPGKVLALLSWTDARAATDPSSGAARSRTRVVRIIRDYGMFDRRESPQYFPPARASNSGPDEEGAA
ncbi:heme-degrading monooxygenase HmoA [Methylobacterium sp. PvR107]|nr:heme-degrading monooxygenase HmoA [Methylobacterium sp. PvR107]